MAVVLIDLQATKLLFLSVDYAFGCLVTRLGNASYLLFAVCGILPRFNLRAFARVSVS